MAFGIKKRLRPLSWRTLVVIAGVLGVLEFVRWENFQKCVLRTEGDKYTEYATQYKVQHNYNITTDGVAWRQANEAAINFGYAECAKQYPYDLFPTADTAVWHTLNYYKGLITNGLDLISFFLVAPEILRRVAPDLFHITRWIIWILAALAFYFVPMVLIVLSIPNPPYIIGVPLVAVVVFAGSVAMLSTPFLIDAMKTWIDRVVGRNLLAAGIIMFVVSRLYSLILALHEMLLMKPV